LFRFIFCFFQTLLIFVSKPPDKIITNGAGVCIPAFFISKFFKCKTIFIESFSRINNPSLFGRLVRNFADEVYFQWRPLEKYYCRGNYVGSIVSSNEKRSNNFIIDILIILGSGPAFPRPLKSLDNFLKNSNKKLRIIAQTGELNYKSEFFKSYNYIPRLIYNNLIDKSRLIITPDGAGNILTIMSFGKKAIVIPRQKELKEIKISNTDLSSEIERLGLYPVLFNLDSLPETIDNALMASSPKIDILYNSNLKCLLESIRS